VDCPVPLNVRWRSTSV